MAQFETRNRKVQQRRTIQNSLIPAHGGYRRLRSFQIAQLVFDVTVRFCDRYIDRRSRTHDQMVQAARSGVQNIAEGSEASGTSKKMELKLTNVARASLEELKLDYEDFLRQRRLGLWPEGDPRRTALVAHRCTTADEVAAWVREVRVGEGTGPNGPEGRNGQRYPATADGTQEGAGSIRSMPSTRSIEVRYSAIAANAAHVLVGVACALLDRQIERLAADFERDGGFTERLYRVRSGRR
ncbi:MAG TPA: four helix bundle suffix domain-containing protein [Candidatus Didemnitutus sp.]|nr:four helix bundle suffix domain-containing protein [Candidatus Didemnitutus sp.]